MKEVWNDCPLCGTMLINAEEHLFFDILLLLKL